MSEALAICRAHVAARGGNGLLGYRVECRLVEPSKNQAYSVISLNGDAVRLLRHKSGPGGRGSDTGEALMDMYRQNKSSI